jgi:hypothetical protein
MSPSSNPRIAITVAVLDMIVYILERRAATKVCPALSLLTHIGDLHLDLK